jgi:hypothetical protein
MRSMRFTGLVFCIVQLALFASDPVVAQSPTSAPRKCEIRQPAWCMYQELSEITDRLETSGPRNHIWTMYDVDHRHSVLVILEPFGCRQGFADTVVALGFDENVGWQGKTWDRMRVRLRQDGSCDLTMLVPLFDGDPLEWAFSVGRALIMACRDEKCTPTAPTPADVTNQYRDRFRRSVMNPKPASGLWNDTRRPKCMHGRRSSRCRRRSRTRPKAATTPLCRFNP